MLRAEGSSQGEQRMEARAEPGVEAALGAEAKTEAGF